MPKPKKKTLTLLSWNVNGIRAVYKKGLFLPFIPAFFFFSAYLLLIITTVTGQLPDKIPAGNMIK